MVYIASDWNHPSPMEANLPLYTILLKALKASGDIDELHAISVSLPELRMRWNAIQVQLSRKSSALNIPQRKRIAAWICAGILDDCLAALMSEALRTKHHPLTAAFSHLCFDRSKNPMGQDLLTLLAEFTSIFPHCCGDPLVLSSLASKASDTFMLSFLEFLSIMEEITSISLQHPAATVDIVDIVNFQRSACLGILAALARSNTPTITTALPYSREVQELALRFALLSRSALLAAIKLYGTDFIQRHNAVNVLVKSTVIVELVTNALAQNALQLNVVANNYYSLSEITGFPTWKIFEEALDIAEIMGEAPDLPDISGANAQAHEYQAVSRMFVVDSSEPVLTAARELLYITRSIRFIRRLLSDGFRDTGNSQANQGVDLIKHVVLSWLICLQKSSGDDSMLAEAIDGGIVFILETLTVRDLSLHVPELLHPLLDILRSGSDQQLQRKLMRQRIIAQNRLEQNTHIHLERSQAWALDLRLNDPLTTRALRDEMDNNEYCFNHGCGSLQAAGLWCSGCKEQYYCSKECQRALVALTGNSTDRIAGNCSRITTPSREYYALNIAVMAYVVP
ncbi:hypothetical protein DL93DRAFT_2153524 [Clavulina sp. PMI_390]|nr:hypothetical protein DL93DRAFT_2153524 [Clavulina sp. PMI_390]